MADNVPKIDYMGALAKLFGQNKAQAAEPLGQPGITPETATPAGTETISDSVDTPEGLLSGGEVTMGSEPTTLQELLAPQTSGYDLSELEKKLKPYIERQKANNETNRQVSELYAKQPVKTDYSPLYGLIDNWSGSNLSKSYDKPSSQEERLKLQSALQDKYASGQDKLTGVELSLLKMAARPNSAQTWQQRLDFNAHQKTLARLAGNTQLNQRLTQLQNLSGNEAIVNLSKSLTPQTLFEAQQAVRGNLGLKGQTIGSEREKTYVDNLGLKSEVLNQFLTGKMSNISKDNDVVKHFLDMIGIEKSNAEQQFDARLNALMSGNESVYKRHPELRADLMQAAKAYRAQTNPLKAPKAPSMVRVVSPEGKSGAIPAEKLEEALKAGYKKQ